VPIPKDILTETYHGIGIIVYVEVPILGSWVNALPGKFSSSIYVEKPVPIVSTVEDIMENPDIDTLIGSLVLILVVIVIIVVVVAFRGNRSKKQIPPPPPLNESIEREVLKDSDDITEKLEKLKELEDKGLITHEDYERAKNKMLEKL